MARYYRSWKFAALDLSLGFCSLFFNPYRTCRKFLAKRGEREVYTYGETPLTVFAELAREVELGQDDLYLELGSGRGKTCMWAAHFIGCESVGVEWVPLFARLSSALAWVFRLKACFRSQSILETDVTGATVVYLYVLEHREQLVQHLRNLKPGARLITISEPLDDDAFLVLKTVPVLMAYCSGGRPKLSQPIGWSTLNPRWRL